MLIYNVHTLQKTFAITFIERESFESLLDRITRKSGLKSLYIQAIKSGQDGGLVYEYKGEKYSLEDDDDLAILVERFPPASTPSVTLHLTAEVDGPQAKSTGQGQNHAHFAPSPPSYNTAAGNIKSKAQKSSAQKDNQPPSALKNSKSKSGETNGSSPKDVTKSNGNKQSNGNKESNDNKESSGSVKLAPPLPPIDKILKKIDDKKEPEDHKTGSKTSEGQKQSEGKSDGHKQSKQKSQNGEHGSRNGGQSEEKPKTGWRAQAPSIMSTRSKKSRYGGDEDAEPMHVVHARKWEEFHANRGVRTIVGEVGGVPNVRMLLEKGHKNVYVSRQFAIKNGMVDSNYTMGRKGYTGLKILGNISITVGSKTGTHLAMISEEEHFDVVLGRVWLEKSGIKIDSIDQTLLTYMENGEVIPCDIVVLKDDEGNKILIT